MFRLFLFGSVQLLVFFMRQPGIEWHQGDCEEPGIRIPFARARTSPTRTGELQHRTVNLGIFKLNA